jgi:hypothetical protein
MNILARFNYGVLALSLLIAAVVWAPTTAAASKKKPPNTSDSSDLNNDGVVDYADLTLFSSIYLEQDVSTIDWCVFIDATGLEGELYGRPPDYYTKHFGFLLSFTSDYFGCGDRSDLNGDRIINTRDLRVFSEQYANEHFLTVDWCVFQQAILDGAPMYGEPTDFFLTHYGGLVLLIQNKFKCTGAPPPDDALALENIPKSLTRFAASRNFSGDYYVTDNKVGSVFIYDSNLVLKEELKGLSKPIGIAVNSFGHILVGSDKKNNIEVYSPDNGELLASFGETELELPVSITVDSSDKVYVTDAGSNTVYVYASDYQLINSIGEPGRDEHQLFSPGDAALSVDESELLVLDRLNRLIKVYDLDGNYLRAIHPEPPVCRWNGCSGGTPFSKLQAMDMTSDGKLHVLDIFDVMIAVFESQTGAFVTSYGSYGDEDGQLRLPMDLLVEEDRVLVLDSRKKRIEVLVP